MASYAATNRGKRNVGLDLKKDGALSVFFKLIQRADVLIDNMRPDVPTRLGVHYEAIARINPRIVRCTITGWGDGPLRDSPCFDPLLQARGGLTVAQGGDDDPVLLAMPVHDVGSGTIGAFGTLAALYARLTIGVGQEVTTSLTNASLMLQAGEVTSFTGSSRSMSGSRDFAGPSTSERLYRCRDGWVALSAGSLGPEAVRLALDDLLPSTIVPKYNEIESVLASIAVGEALDRLAGVGIPAVQVLGRDDIFDDPWLSKNRFFMIVDDTKLGPVRTVGAFAEWEEAPDDEHRFSRSVGDDTVVVLQEAGVDNDEIARWV